MIIISSSSTKSYYGGKSYNWSYIEAIIHGNVTPIWAKKWCHGKPKGWPERDSASPPFHKGWSPKRNGLNGMECKQSQKFRCGAPGMVIIQCWTLTYMTQACAGCGGAQVPCGLQELKLFTSVVYWNYSSLTGVHNNSQRDPIRHLAIPRKHSPRETI